MARHAPSSFFLLLACTNCSVPPNRAPSLAPRPSEAIDPRIPVLGEVDQRPVDPAIAAQLSRLIAQAHSGDTAFHAAIAEAERLTAVAGVRESESWIAAQQALSIAVAARSPTTRALGDIDAVAASILKSKGDVGPADRAAIDAAATEAGALDRAQAAIIDALQKRLGS